MNAKKQQWIVFLITLTIVTTIGVQFYWNYKNYLENKRQITNEIQISLDNALDAYYSNISKNNFFTYISGDSLNHSKEIFARFLSKNKDSYKIKFSYNSFGITSKDSLKRKRVPQILDSIFLDGDSITSKVHIESRTPIKRPIRVIKGTGIVDSLRVIKGIESVYIALTNDDLDFKRLDSLFQNQLDDKQIATSHYFQMQEGSIVTKTNKTEEEVFHLKVHSKSNYLRANQHLVVHYSDPTLSALKKSSSGILLSFLLSLAVIFSLGYLLKVINQQKQLAEIKNDLISNITHEFKTPIATVSTALEAIQSFNVLDDKEKTERYLNMSSNQLKKLHLMVEKLLETATLDSENLILKKETTDLVDFVDKIVKRHQNLTDKDLHFSSNLENIMGAIDTFHFENAIANLIDNAIKYGGDTVEITLTSVLNQVEVSIADNGEGIDKSQQDKIFDKFYRVPKGNTHDVKGFGIGLYYTKKIIEKHGGTIHLTSSNTNTIFKITLPNE